MAKFASRVKETTPTTGAGALSLTGAVSGYRGFLAPPNIVDQDYVPYILLDANGTDWEEGYGKIVAGPTNQLERSFVMDSSNGGAAISLSAGAHMVGIGPTAFVEQPRYAVVKMLADASTPPNTDIDLQFDGLIADTDGMWSALDPAKLTIPDWASVVELSANVRFDVGGTGFRRVSILSNAVTEPIARSQIQAADTMPTIINLHAQAIDVQPGTFFKTTIHHGPTPSATIVAGVDSWFAVRIIA